MKKTIISIALCLALLLYCCIISSSAQNVSEDTNYRLMVLQDGTYQCDFLDNNNNIIHTEQTPKYPDVRRLSSRYILYKVQAGTGVGTNWGFFYDSSRVCLSDTFYGIMDTEGDLVLCCLGNSLTVSSIFDNSIEKTITQFSCPFSSVAQPIISASFSISDGCIDVCYYSGENYSEIEETISYTENSEIRIGIDFLDKLDGQYREALNKAACRADYADITYDYTGKNGQIICNYSEKVINFVENCTEPYVVDHRGYYAQTLKKEFEAWVSYASTFFDAREVYYNYCNGISSDSGIRAGYDTYNLYRERAIYLVQTYNDLANELRATNNFE